MTPGRVNVAYTLDILSFFQMNTLKTKVCTGLEVTPTTRFVCLQISKWITNEKLASLSDRPCLRVSTARQPRLRGRLVWMHPLSVAATPSRCFKAVFIKTFWSAKNASFTRINQTAVSLFFLFFFSYNGNRIVKVEREMANDISDVYRVLSDFCKVCAAFEFEIRGEIALLMSWWHQRYTND